MWRLVLTVSLLCCSSEGSVTCKDENNGEVDWYILYKAPEQNTLTGLEYLYIDSTGMRKMAPSTPSASPVGAGTSSTTYKPISDPKGVLGYTLLPLLQPVRQMPETFGFISYSDQPPGCSADSNKFGHSKGVVMVEKDKTGVWLVHSTPQFPFRRHEKYFWPPSGTKYAQTFMCVTFNYGQFEHIGKHLQYIGAFPFEYYIPLGFHPDLIKATDWVQAPPPSSPQDLTSRGNQKFRSFAKQKSKNKQNRDGNLYFIISKEFKSDLKIRTWGCQKKSYCGQSGQPKLLNIKSLKTDLGEWEKNDHSKWCVAVNKPWTCIADLNTANKQYKRLGGALCIENEAVRTIFKNFDKSVGDCSDTEEMDVVCSDAETEGMTVSDAETEGMTDSG